MIIIEVLASKIADRIALQLGLNHERRSVIAYGMTGFLQIIMLSIVIVVFGVISDTFYESVIIFVIVGFIRKSTGGAHSETIAGCNTISVLSVALLALSSKYLLDIQMGIYANLGITLTVFLIVFIIFNRYVPVDSPNKPIVTEKKIARLRKESFTKLLFFFLLTTGAILMTSTYEAFFSIAASIRIAVIWQTMTLTKPGTLLISKLDSEVNKVLNRLTILKNNF